MNGAIKSELKQLVEEISDVGGLRQSFKKSIGLMEAKDNEGKIDVPWHGFSHSGGNTAIALRGMLNMHDAPAESMYLVGIAGMLHDIGYYSRHPELGVIKFGHEQRSREFVLKEAEKHGIILTDEQKAIANLIISMTEMSIGAKVWVSLFEALRKGDRKSFKLIIARNKLKDILSISEKIYEDWPRWTPVMEFALLGGMMLAYLDINDPRPDAVTRKADLHEEIGHDIGILDAVSGKEGAENQIRMLKGMYRDRLDEQLQDTHNFLTGFGKPRIEAFGEYIYEYIPLDAKLNMAATGVTAARSQAEVSSKEFFEEAIKQDKPDHYKLMNKMYEDKRSFGKNTRVLFALLKQATTNYAAGQREDIDTDSIATLGLTTRPLKVLSRLGIITVTQLRAALESLPSERNIGDVNMSEIRNALAREASAAARGADDGGAQANVAAAGKSKLVVTDNIEFYLGALRLKKTLENVQIIPFKVSAAASKKELDNILKELKNIYDPNEVYIYLNNSVKADDLIAGGIEAKMLKGDPKTALQTLEAV